MQSDYGIKQSPFSNSNEHYEWTLAGKELQVLYTNKEF